MRIKIFLQDHLPVHANASGDGDGVPGRCCRLCGGDTNLRYFGDTYVWEGVEERYDQLLFDCFGVKVTPADCMICEWCVRALRNTERFRALVHAAFDHRPSDVSSSTTLKSISTKYEATSIKQEKEQKLKPKCEVAKRRDARKRFFANGVKAKRINIPCDVCKQRYPMLISSDERKTFVCSRCKKNDEIKGGALCRKCNIMMPSNMLKEHLDLHAKAQLRGKARLQQAKKSTLLSVNSTTKQRAQKFQCTRCPKKYAMARNLVLHVRIAHGDSLDTLCSVCGQNMITREKLESHLATHGSPHQCYECLLIFKNKQALVAHSTSHHIKSTSTSS
ncbi:PR domain zinc finger protein 5-like [Spodoptera litura]|uniref:PR domain zinc finger protein 5-like n=1 Tax=Spodoptera litura TaxID=69820 RepID=A0A9J7DV94_SPOLT|nr:PR domain zinc finger protein 5-like [Spodoptera litura]